MIPWLGAAPVFPPVETALAQPNGLLAAGGDLSVPRLLSAYAQGIFPWYAEGEPILWWSPDPRMVLYPSRLHIPRSLGKILRNRAYEIRFDTAFADVMHGCAASPRPGQDGTWIVPEVIAAYCALHEAGHAHSAECWIDGELAGGLYGVALGKMFYGESMFTHRPDASKLAFVHLVQWLQAQGYGLIDCQMHTEHLSRFGGEQIQRSFFLQRLRSLIREPAHVGRWQYHHVNEPQGHPT